jgi:hypothetical protein
MSETENGLVSSAVRTTVVGEDRCSGVVSEGTTVGCDLDLENIRPKKPGRGATGEAGAEAEPPSLEAMAARRRFWCGSALAFALLDSRSRYARAFSASRRRRRQRQQQQQHSSTTSNSTRIARDERSSSTQPAKMHCLHCQLLCGHSPPNTPPGTHLARSGQ